MTDREAREYVASANGRKPRRWPRVADFAVGALMGLSIVVAVFILITES